MMPASSTGIKSKDALEKINLGLSSRGVFQDGYHFPAAALYFVYKAFYRAITAIEMAFFLEVLPDALGAQTTLQ
jgi:hypothetical protein